MSNFYVNKSSWQKEVSQEATQIQQIHYHIVSLQTALN